MSVREELVETVDNCCENTSQKKCDEYHSQSLSPCDYCVVDAILSHPRIGVIAEDQSLPYCRYGYYTENAAGRTFVPIEWRLDDTGLADFKRIMQ